LPSEISKCGGNRYLKISSNADGNVAISLKRITLDDSATGKRAPLYKSAAPVLTETARWREVAIRSSARPYRDFRVFENLRALPRAWLAGAVEEAFEGDQLKQIRGELKSSKGSDFNPRTTVLVEPIHEPVKRWYAPYLTQAENFSGSAKIIERKHDYVRLETDSSGPSLLVLSEIALPGWRARVDGHDVEWRRVNYMLRAVTLGGGRHTVEFRYRPSSIAAGAAVSLTTALALVLIFLFAGRRRNRQD
jgi:hypothetical protein